MYHYFKDVMGVVYAYDAEFSDVPAGMTGISEAEALELAAQRNADLLPKAYKQFTGKDKFALFTPEERRAITSAAMTDIDMKMFYDIFTIADYITYDDPEMQDGLHFLEHHGFITPARHAEIISKMSE